MGTVRATLNQGAVGRRTRSRGRAAPKVTKATLRDLLDRALADVDADVEAGPVLRAAGLRARLRIRDVGLVLDVEPSEEGAHHLRWTFSGRGDREPELELAMDSQSANAYLQGRESLAIGMARNRVRLKGDTRCALRYLPAMRAIVDAYRRLVRRDHPELVV
jgi:hypothetical protein